MLRVALIIREITTSWAFIAIDLCFIPFTGVCVSLSLGRWLNCDSQGGAYSFSKITNVKTEERRKKGFWFKKWSTRFISAFQFNVNIHVVQLHELNLSAVNISRKKDIFLFRSSLTSFFFFCFDGAVVLNVAHVDVFIPSLVNVAWQRRPRTVDRIYCCEDTKNSLVKLIV